MKVRKRVLMWFLVISVLVVPLSLSAAQKMTVGKVRSILKAQGFSNVKVLGVEKAPLKGLYMVYVEMPGGKKAAFVLNDSGRYILTGKLIDLKKNRRDVLWEVGIDKGYLLPAGVSLKGSKVKIDTTGSPTFGSKKAPQVIVFFDPLCPYCLRELQDMKPLVDRGKVRLVLKFFIIHGAKSRALASRALCLYQKGKKDAFWQYILSKGAKGGELKSKCDEGKIEYILTRDGEEAKKLQFKGTPTIIIKDRYYIGYMGPKVLSKLLAK